MFLGLLLNMLFLQLFFTIVPRIKEATRLQWSCREFYNEISETVNRYLGEVK